MRKRIFDELNKLEPDYFEPMQISNDDKTRRRDLSDLLIDAFLFFFATFEVHKAHDSVLTKQLYSRLLTDRVSDAVSKVTGIDAYMSKHITEMSKEVVNTTFKNADKADNKPEKQNTDLDKGTSPDPSESLTTTPSSSSMKPPYSEKKPKPISRTISTPDGSKPKGNGQEDTDEDGSYWLSYRRAEDIAKSEANTFLNYTDYLDAKDRGCKQKTWLTMLDDKVRNTHEEVEGQTIGIDEMFTVGNSLMKFPHDLSESPDPKEVINCRCAVEYK